jgi:hypothetical protein
MFSCHAPVRKNKLCINSSSNTEGKVFISLVIVENRLIKDLYEIIKTFRFQKMRLGTDALHLKD